MKEAACEELLNDDDWKDHLKQIQKEFSKAKPEEKHLKMLLEACHARNRRWFGTMDDGVLKPIMKCIPCYEDGTYVSKT